MCNACEHGKMMAKKGYVFDDAAHQFVNKRTGKPAPANLQHHHHNEGHEHGGSFFNY